jgi:predicted DCC family thiol-disulfide oxidoreductase YuxK
LRLVPRAWRDAVYDWAAANRYRWFGRACLAPDPAWAERVLD